MVNKLTDKTERMSDMLLTRLNESNAGRDAQHAAVNTQLAAMNKRIEDLERGTVQLQQQHHHHLPGRAGILSPRALNVPAILTSGNNANNTRTGAGATHGHFCAGVVTWLNSFENLASDHRVLCVTEGDDENEEDTCRNARIVDWDRFRKNRERDKEGPIKDISEWCKPPREGGERSHGGGDDGAPQPSRVDSWLAHLVALRKSMQRRASKQKLDSRKIRKKIDEINQNVELGVHNTLEAQRIAQLERLSGTRTGIRILGLLGIRYHEARVAIQTENMPKNMHPVYDMQGRKRRGVAILEEHGRREGVLFVDADR
ncbi:hypothetical protein HPB49_020275 [Dermacentor silvarum]|uniref:Uncharacterized protein n=1 Tax=Dermacentor silvarum TaxID=543639 RepID=A0ACB8DR38_DERSI|nr:hypothetical protein HPB49_020275 [Dermacentor silvarum]